MKKGIIFLFVDSDCKTHEFSSDQWPADPHHPAFHFDPDPDPPFTPM
jgi:hypothetical protein